MIVDDDDVGKDASNGKFIWMEGKPATGGGGTGYGDTLLPGMVTAILSG